MAVSGTVGVCIRKHVMLDLSCLRKGIDADQTLPPTWLTDAACRDLTFNSMSVWCDVRGDVQLYDPCNGEADLATKTIRFVGHGLARLNEGSSFLHYFSFEWELVSPTSSLLGVLVFGRTAASHPPGVPPTRPVRRHVRDRDMAALVRGLG